MATACTPCASISFTPHDPRNSPRASSENHWGCTAAWLPLPGQGVQLPCSTARCLGILLRQSEHRKCSAMFFDVGNNIPMTWRRGGLISFIICLFFYLLYLSLSLSLSLGFFFCILKHLDKISHSQAVCFIIRFRNIDLNWLGCGPGYRLIV